MKKTKRCIFVLSFFLILYTPYVVHGAGVDTIIDETEDITAPYGYSVADTARDVLAGENKYTFSGAMEWVFNLLFGAVRENLSVILKMTAAGLISGIAAHLSGEKNEAGTVCCVAIVALMALKSFSFALTTAEETIDSMLLFVQALLPPIAAAAAATGHAAQTAACGIVFSAMQVFIYLCKEILLPAVSVITALSVVDHFSETPYLKGIVSMLKQGMKWGIGLLLILYGGVIGLQTQTAGTFDNLAGKTVKYAVGSFVPVVGGALSDSLEMVTTGARAIKSALGIGGIIGVCCVCIGPLVNVCAVALSYKLASAVCSVTCEKRVAGVISEVGGSLVRVCGVLLSVSVMFIISLSMLCRFAGGGTQ